MTFAQSEQLAAVVLLDALLPMRALALAIALSYSALASRLHCIRLAAVGSVVQSC